jgi:hypothetical protein
LAGRPELVTGTSQILFGGMRRLSEGSVISVKNRSHSITAEIEVDDGAASGVIIAQGGAFGGWSLYVIRCVLLTLERQRRYRMGRESWHCDLASNRPAAITPAARLTRPAAGATAA